MKGAALALLALPLGVALGVVGTLVVSRPAPIPAPVPGAGPGKAPEPSPPRVRPAPSGADGGLGSASAADRTRALRRLRADPDPAAIPDLLRFLETETDPGLRSLAYDALARTGDPALIPGLLAAFRSEPDFRLRHAALEAAIAIGSPEVDRVLEEILRSGDDSRESLLLCELAAEGLVRGGRAEGHAFIEEFLREGAGGMADDAGWSARTRMLRALAESGGDEGVLTLLSLARDGSLPADLRGEALLALGEAVGEGRAEAIASILDVAIASGDPEVREESDLRVAAIRALGSLREDPAAAATLAALAGGARSVPEDVRLQAVVSLGRVGGPEASEALLGMARDPSVPVRLRTQAWSSYGSSAGAAGVPVLEEAALRAPELPERLAAVRSLGLAPAAVRRTTLERVAGATADEKVRSLAQAYLR